MGGGPLYRRVQPALSVEKQVSVFVRSHLSGRGVGGKQEHSAGVLLREGALLLLEGIHL